MKRITLLCLLFFASFASAAEKSGIAKFDRLNYVNGKTILFFDEEGMESKKQTKDSVIERKIFKQGKSYIVADYFLNKQPILVYETQDNPNKSSELRINGHRVAYDENGKIVSIGQYKNGLEEGTHIHYRENGTVFKTVFKNGKLIKSE